MGTEKRSYFFGDFSTKTGPKWNIFKLFNAYKKGCQKVETMRLKLQRYSDNGESTLGLFYIDNQFKCYTLEDGFRKEKVPGETRIPSGVYEVTLRTEGGMHERYLKKFPGFHKGMIWLRNVSNFEYVLIHIGNSSDDTNGCILVGSPLIFIPPRSLIHQVGCSYRLNGSRFCGLLRRLSILS